VTYRTQFLFAPAGQDGGEGRDLRLARITAIVSREVIRVRYFCRPEDTRSGREVGGPPKSAHMLRPYGTGRMKEVIRASVSQAHHKPREVFILARESSVSRKCVLAPADVCAPEVRWFSVF